MHARNLWLVLLCVLLAAPLAAGCRGRGGAIVRGEESRFGAAGVDRVTQTAFPLEDDAVRLVDSGQTLYVFDGRNGEPMTGRQVLSALRSADVVILGEMHTDVTGHRLQQRLVREALAAGRGALSLEMMQRGDQAVLDRLLRRRGQSGAGSRDRFAPAEAALQDTSLAGWTRWRSFYLPVVESALALGRPVVAANAPPELVRRARQEGYDSLRDLPAEQRRLVVLPTPQQRYSDYRRRFEEAMGGHGDVSPTTRPGAPTTQPATRPARERMDAHAPLQDAGATTQDAGPEAELAAQAQTRPASTRPALTRPMRADANSIEAFFDAQLVWDATMADSIAQARRRHGAPVVHLVGSFHSDFDGGLTRMLREKRLDVVTISLVPGNSERLAPADAGRADIVIYTGPPQPLPAEPAPQTRPAQDPRGPRTPAVVGSGSAAPTTGPATQPRSRRPR